MSLTVQAFYSLPELFVSLWSEILSNYHVLSLLNYSINII